MTSRKTKKTKKLPVSTLVISISARPSKIVKTLQSRKKNNGKKKK